MKLKYLNKPSVFFIYPHDPTIRLLIPDVDACGVQHGLISARGERKIRIDAFYMAGRRLSFTDLISRFNFSGVEGDFEWSTGHRYKILTGQGEIWLYPAGNGQGRTERFDTSWIECSCCCFSNCNGERGVVVF